MNIRVDLSTPIFDGAEVKFRSPADCSQVTGLVVCYDGGSQEFIFADAHGNNVGDIDHLFTEDVVVKVILDVTKGMAFVQNADTNAYLESRFESIESKVGNAVIKNPDGSVEVPKLFINKQCLGYGVVSFISSGGNPIEVKNTVMKYGRMSGLTLYLYGKNLFDANAHTWVKSYINTSTGKVNTSSSDYWICTEDYIRVVPLRNQYITLNHAPGDSSTRAGMAFYKKDGTFISGTNESTVKVPGTAYTMRLTVPAKYATEESDKFVVSDIQIALDTEITAYEPYSVTSHEVFFGMDETETIPCGGTFDWSTGVYTDPSGVCYTQHNSVQQVLDRPGINTIIIEPIDNAEGITSNSIDVKYKVDVDSQLTELSKFHYDAGLESLIAKVIELDTKYGIDNLIENLEKISGWL